MLVQLHGSIGEEAQTQLEKVLAEHTETKKKLEAAQTALTQASIDNSQMAAHYQHYTAQLTAQTQTLQEQARLCYVAIIIMVIVLIFILTTQP